MTGICITRISDSRPSIGDVFLEGGQWNLPLDALCLCLSTQVNIHHVTSQRLQTDKCSETCCCSPFKFTGASGSPYHVPLLVVLVFDDEDHVKTGQDGGHEVNIFLPFCVIPAAEHRVGCSQHRAARVQCGGDSGLEETAR